MAWHARWQGVPVHRADWQSVDGRISLSADRRSESVYNWTSMDPFDCALLSFEISRSQVGHNHQIVAVCYSTSFSSYAMPISTSNDQHVLRINPHPESTQ